MKFDKRYWTFIAAAVSCSTVASACTLYLSYLQREQFMECNSTSAACFSVLGMVPCMVLGILSLIPVMVAIPYLFRRNEQLHIAPVIVLSLIVAYTALDAINNVAAVLGYYHIYLFAHSALSTTNNITGTIAGTGKSLC
ncbi:MAG: hypothetical protein A4E35_00736 [Methanoregula sp. PtaU1.Bin051]|nr:MAG: hypothetical protein A4E35_00736 [Methanoregula sp. PtaU1.Bin051]